MKKIEDIRSANLADLAKEFGSQGQLSEVIEKSPAQISQWINQSKYANSEKRRTMERETARHIEKKTGKPEGWMDQLHESIALPGQEIVHIHSRTWKGGPSSYKEGNILYVISANDGDDFSNELPNDASFEIDYWDARGSCGGGSLNWETELKGKLIKEASWFKKYGIKPSNALVVYADGDSMADFIVDGDIVIFDRSKTEPKSGKIFLIQHPDGLRIKQLRREIDGTWLLESRNLDKRKFPDERISPGHADLLVVKGEFVYRQGG